MANEMIETQNKYEFLDKEAKQKKREIQMQ